MSLNLVNIREGEKEREIARKKEDRWPFQKKINDGNLPASGIYTKAAYGKL